MWLVLKEARLDKNGEVAKRKRKAQSGHQTPEQAASAGFAIAKFEWECRNKSVPVDILIKSFTLKFDGDEWLLILRGQEFAGDALVQFKRLSTLVGLGGVLLTMLEGEWKTDKYG